MRECFQLLRLNLRYKRTTAGVALAIATTCLWAATDPLVDLKAGSVALDAKRYATAIPLLEPLGKRLPKLADYSAWFLASAQFGLKNYAAVPATLETVWKQKPPSPLAARAYILAAQAYEQSGAPNTAVEILRNNYAVLPQPQGDLALATAFALAGDAVSAAVYNQRVYYGFPVSVEAGPAEAEIAKLKAQLGDNYPPSMANAMLSRALKLLDAGQTPRAKKELESLVPQLGGGDRDVALVSVGVADYNAKETDIARRYLASLETPSPDADAERLYYLLLSAQRLNNEEEAGAMAEKLGQLYPTSPWRLKGVVAVANHYLVLNQMEQYEPLFRACYESFPQDPQAAVCHWKVVWGHYLRRRPDAVDLLRAHLRLFPAAESASAALYFLGRSAEDARDTKSARTYFDEVVREYPNQYYASQARQHLAAIPDTATAPAVSQFLKSVVFPQRVRTLSFQAAAAASARIERARLLVSAGLEDLANAELRFGAQTEDQPHVLAMELASLSSPTMPDQAIRYIKRYASSYLFLPIESAPRQFWTLAFPLPYRADLDRFSKQNGLDPFLMAALIRQESQFDPTAVSRANARGLTQIMPATGRELSRRLNVKTFTTAALFQPSINLELGTFYLKTLTSQVGGRTEAALAAYDAGLTRARAWLTWGEFREPAEFIETVPFAETRDYVQTVLRNADVYRRLYTNQ